MFSRVSRETLMEIAVFNEMPNERVSANGLFGQRDSNGAFDSLVNTNFVTFFRPQFLIECVKMSGYCSDITVTLNPQCATLLLIRNNIK